jgi:colicin import membrane protein
MQERIQNGRHQRADSLPPLTSSLPPASAPHLRPCARSSAAATPPFRRSLNEWKARQKEAAAPLREPAPQAVGERLAEVGADIWAMALGLANSRLAAERESLEKARADMDAAQAEAAELADKLAGEVEALQSRLASIETAEQTARTEADELRGQLTAAQEQAHTAEARAVEIERRAGELRAELDRAHQDADQVRQATWPSSRRPTRSTSRPA